MCLPSWFYDSWLEIVGFIAGNAVIVTEVKTFFLRQATFFYPALQLLLSAISDGGSLSKRRILIKILNERFIPVSIFLLKMIIIINQSR